MLSLRVGGDIMTTKLNFAQQQYNGIILLSSYIERLIVQQSVYVRLGAADEKKLNEYKYIADDLHIILQVFENTKDLTVGQFNKLMDIYTHINQLFPAFFNKSPLTSTEQVALVTASFYGERHLNQKIIHLGKLFNAPISVDFEKRMDFYDERINLMEFVVLALSKGDEIDSRLIKHIATWTKNVLKIRKDIVKDMDKIPVLLQRQ